MTTLDVVAVVVAAARLQSLSVSVAVSTGLADGAEAQAVASAVEIGAAEQLSYSCQIRRRDLTVGRVAAGKPYQKKMKIDIHNCRMDIIYHRCLRSKPKNILIGRADEYL